MKLTAQEAGIACLVAKGLVDEAIAGELGIPKQTVKNTLSGVYKKVFKRGGCLNPDINARVTLARMVWEGKVTWDLSRLAVAVGTAVTRRPTHGPAGTAYVPTRDAYVSTRTVGTYDAPPAYS